MDGRKDQFREILFLSLPLKYSPAVVAAFKQVLEQEVQGRDKVISNYYFKDFLFPQHLLESAAVTPHFKGSVHFAFRHRGEHLNHLGGLDHFTLGLKLFPQLSTE